MIRPTSTLDNPLYEKSLITLASEATNGKLGVNEVVSTPTHGGLNHYVAMHVCAPETGEASLRACYRAIFTNAAKENVTTVCVPSFSTRNGCFAPDVAARIAVEEASNFIKTNDKLRIRFVTFLSKDGERRDEVNAESYKKALTILPPTLRIQAVEGEIQNLIGDLIVIPVGKNYQNPGAVSLAVEATVLERRRLYNQKNDAEPVLPPPEIMQHILFSCDLPTIGKASIVNKLFSATVKLNTFWQGIAQREVPGQYKLLQLDKEHDFKNFVKIHTDWTLSPEEDKCIKIMSNNACYRAGAYLPSEFRQAYTCMKEGKPENFTSSERQGQGTHQAVRNNAIDFLNDCIDEESAFRQIITVYLEKDEELLTVVSSPKLFDPISMPANEVAKVLNALLDKTERKLANKPK